MRRGAILRPAQIGVLASLGRATVRVIRRPVVAVLSTGDELVEVGRPLRPGAIYDSNTYSVAAMVIQNGGIPALLGIARDTVEDLTAKIRQGLDADMLLTSAGVSRGDYDVVKDVLAREGEVDFWTVRMKPGKPLAFGTFDSGGRRVPHIGLPGNPVSSMVTFELFGRPAILKMMGKSRWQRPTVRAIAEDRIANTDGRRVFARSVVSRARRPLLRLADRPAGLWRPHLHVGGQRPGGGPRGRARRGARRGDLRDDAGLDPGRGLTRRERCLLLSAW